MAGPALGSAGATACLGGTRADDHRSRRTDTHRPCCPDLPGIEKLRTTGGERRRGSSLLADGPRCSSPCCPEFSWRTRSCAAAVVGVVGPVGLRLLRTRPRAAHGRARLWPAAARRGRAGQSLPRPPALPLAAAASSRRSSIARAQIVAAPRRTVAQYPPSWRLFGSDRTGRSRSAGTHSCRTSGWPSASECTVTTRADQR